MQVLCGLLYIAYSKTYEVRSCLNFGNDGQSIIVARHVWVSVGLSSERAYRSV